ncbi:MAG: mycofactocin-coupled SDR family oxidoreductase [Acidimicrobiales bacterium]
MSRKTGTDDKTHLQVAVVTGAARGIGAATVRALDAAGWAVVAVDRASPDVRLPYAMATPDDLDAVVAGTSDRVIGVVADAADEQAMAAAVARAEADFGGLDAMVAVAGVIAGGSPLWKLPAAELAAVLEVDLLGPIVAARVGIPALLRRPEPRHGRYLAVASAAATRGLPLLSAYGAAKAGVTGLVRGLAAELGGTGVTANAVSPGSTATAMLQESARLYGLEDTGQFGTQQPLGRLLDPEEVAAVLVWLAGPTTGALTGAVIPVDGGLAL